MTRLAAIAATACLALGAAACNSDSDSDASPGTTPEATTTTTATTPTTTGAAEERFVRTNLPKLALPASSAPDGLRFSRADSGGRTVDEIAPFSTQKKELQALGFVAAHDAIFDATNQQRSDLRVAQRLYLFRTPAGAGSWMQRTRASALGIGMQDIDAEPLGDSSWAVKGDLPDTQVITHAFRVGNLVVQVSSQTQRTSVSEPQAFAAAAAAESRIVD